MYQENTQIDQIIVMQDGTVCVRNRITVKKDGAEISCQYARMTLAPNSDTSALPKNVQDICAATWTSEVISAYQAKLSN